MASRRAGTPWLLRTVLGALMLSLHVSPSLAQTPSTDAKADLASQASQGDAHDAYKRAFDRHQLIGSVSVALGVAALGAGAYLLLSGAENCEESATGRSVLVRW